MTTSVVTWVRCRAVWVWLAFAAALLVSAACSDANSPRIIEPVEDSLQDSTKLPD